MEPKTPFPLNNHPILKDSMSPSRKYTVLYIEDNPTNRELVRHILELRSNFLYLEAENGKQGLQISKHHHPDLILLDIHLPDMDGFTVFKHLQNAPETADIPVIALTGSASPVDIQIGSAMGFKDFLSKPIDIKIFFAALDSALGPCNDEDRP